jgi:hypothetical protein
LQEVLAVKLTQFSQGNNVLDDPGCNTDGCLCRGTCAPHVSSTAIFGKKRAYQHIEKPTLHEVSFQELTLLSQGNNMQDAAASNTDGFLWRDASVPTTPMNTSLLNKKSLSPP